MNESCSEREQRLKELSCMNKTQLSNECCISALIFENKYLGFTYDIEDGKITKVYNREGKCCA